MTRLGYKFECVMKGRARIPDYSHGIGVICNDGVVANMPQVPASYLDNRLRAHGSVNDLHPDFVSIFIERLPKRAFGWHRPWVSLRSFFPGALEAIDKSFSLSKLNVL